MSDDLEIGDSRIEFIALYVLKTLKLKSDKWTKFYAPDDNKLVVNNALDFTVFNLIN